MRSSRSRSPGSAAPPCFVVRGEACSDVSVAGRMRRVDARGAQPWYVAELNEVDRFALGPLQRSPGDLRPTESDLPLDGGVVFGPWLGWARDVVASKPAPPARPVTAPSPLSELSPYDTNVLGDLGRRAASLTRHRTEPPAPHRRPDGGRRRVPARRPRAGAGRRPVYVGRQLAQPRRHRGRCCRARRVESPSREVSATHIELRPTPQGLVLTDLQSTNGTVVRQPGSGVRRLESGESLPVAPGTLIDIGDGNVIEILAYR